MRIIKGIVVIIGVVLLQRFCHNQTDGFALRKIISELSFHEEWETPSLNQEDPIRQILSQPFFYLGKGAQAYVFVSRDGRYVLKFFRHDHMRTEPWHFLLTKEHRSERLMIARDKLIKDFTSYKIAFDNLREETGLVFLHLNKTNNLNITIPIYDKIGIQHFISLDSMEFILQKKVQPFFPSLQQWIAENNIPLAKQALTELISVLKGRFLKAIYDKDPDLNTNFGFLDGHPIQLDVGRFKQDSFYCNHEVYKREIQRITDNLKQWLDVHSQDLSLHLQQVVNSL